MPGLGKPFPVGHRINVGRKHSSEVRNKKRELWLKKYANGYLSPMFGKTAWNKGKKMLPRSEEYKKKMSLISRGRTFSDKTKAKMRLAKLGKAFTIEHRLKLGKAHVGIMVGEKNPQWKGGVTPLNMLIRNSLDYRIWREAVFKRDNWACVWCGARNGEGKTIVLHADHIKRFADYPHLRFELSNGRTLCAPCHRKTGTFGVLKKLKTYGQSSKILS